MEHSETSIVLVGDVHIERPDAESIFEHAGPFLREADIAFCNLEGPITDVGEETQAKETIKIRSPETAISGLVFAGFDVVSLAMFSHLLRGFFGDRLVQISG